MNNLCESEFGNNVVKLSNIFLNLNRIPQGKPNPFYYSLDNSSTLSDKKMSDLFFVTSKKFRHFCPTFFCPIR